MAIESAVGNGSISILNNNKELGFRVFDTSEPLSHRLVLGIDELVCDLGIKKSDLNLIAVSNGPGSLTGIRIGVAVGLGLSNALGIECVGVSLLESLRRLLVLEKDVISVIPNGRQKVYWQRFDNSLMTQINSAGFDKISELNLAYPKSKFVVEFNVFVNFKNFPEQNRIFRSTENLAMLIGIKAKLDYFEGKFEKPNPFYSGVDKYFNSK